MSYIEDKQMLVIPRSDGLVVRVQGQLYLKPMTSRDMLELSYRCLKAGLEMQREEDRDGVFKRS